jgi:NAD(P)H-dependent FMN reductase
VKLVIVDGSVRQGRATNRVAAWVAKTANEVLNDVDIEVVDLRELQIPMFDEPVLPMMNPDRQPEGDTKVWLDALSSADAFVFVTPEYNHGMPSGLKSAIDYINFQVMHKPFLVVSHGSNGGARSGEQLKQVLNANIGALPVGSSITINGMVGFGDMISEDGTPHVDEVKRQQSGLEDKLQLLVKYAEALAPIRG